MFQWVNLCWKGTADGTRDGLWLVTLEMSANSCSSFSARLQVVAPRCSWKTSAFWMPSSSEKVGNWNYWELLKAWGSCHTWALENLSLHLPSTQGDGLEWDNSSYFPEKMDLTARSTSLCCSPLCRCTASDLCLSQFCPYKPGLLWLKF